MSTTITLKGTTKGRYASVCKYMKAKLSMGNMCSGKPAFMTHSSETMVGSLQTSNYYCNEKYRQEWNNMGILNVCNRMANIWTTFY